MEMQFELSCEDAHGERAVQIIRRRGRIGQRDAGWIYVFPVENASAINSRDGS